VAGSVEPSGGQTMMAGVAGAYTQAEDYGSPLVWALQPGDVIERAILHKRYGGREQGAIGPSRSSPNVLLFSDPPAAEPHGCFDGWKDDGCFHYTGEGQRGDQQMKSGNAAILGHAADGRALRLFAGARGRVTYEGEFDLAPDRPFYTTDASEAKTGQTRNVIVFRLQPTDTRPRPSMSSLDLVNKLGVEDVAVEAQWTEQAFVAPSAHEHEAQRREQALVLAFRDHLVKHGHEVRRLKIVPAGEAKPLFCDLIDRSTNTLYEAKGTVERGAIRMAIGQLLDYARFLAPPPRLSLLLPSEPRSDLRELLKAVGVEAVWRDGRKFVGSISPV
jgi:hypothetical protein